MGNQVGNDVGSMPVQHELRLLCRLDAPRNEPESGVSAMTFLQTVQFALQEGQKRHTMKAMAKLIGIHPPHINDMRDGKRNIKPELITQLCWVTGCNAPRQWLDLDARRIEAESEAVRKEAIFQQINKALKAA